MVCHGKHAHTLAVNQQARQPAAASQATETIVIVGPFVDACGVTVVQSAVVSWL